MLPRHKDRLLTFFNYTLFTRPLGSARHDVRKRLSPTISFARYGQARAFPISRRPKIPPITWTKARDTSARDRLGNEFEFVAFIPAFIGEKERATKKGVFYAVDADKLIKIRPDR